MYPRSSASGSPRPEFGAETLGRLVAHDAEARSCERRRASASNLGSASCRDQYALRTTPPREGDRRQPVPSAPCSPARRRRSAERGIGIQTGIDAAAAAGRGYLNFGVHHAREWPRSSSDRDRDRARRRPRRRRPRRSPRCSTRAESRRCGRQRRRLPRLAQLRHPPDRLTTTNTNLLQINRRPGHLQAQELPPDQQTMPPIPCAMRDRVGSRPESKLRRLLGRPGLERGSDEPVLPGHRARSRSPSQQADARVQRRRSHPTVFITNHTFTDEGKWLRQPVFDGELVRRPRRRDSEGDPDGAGLIRSVDAADRPPARSGVGYETTRDITGATDNGCGPRTKHPVPAPSSWHR